jgi:uncharacterized membrane protein
MILKKTSGRLWEIDLLRGVAVIFMILFHFLYDLNYFSIFKIQLYSGPMLYVAYTTATIFVILVGLSLTISNSKVKDVMTKKELRYKFLKRGTMIFSLGMIITFLSWIFIPDRFIIFGILHCIGISIIISLPLLSFRILNLGLGFFLIFIGTYLRSLTFEFFWLIPLGFLPRRFFTIDYFPLLPWFGVVLIGIAIGNFIFPNAKRLYNLRDRSFNLSVKLLCFLGRNSLIIYFLHQPILIGFIFLFLL